MNARKLVRQTLLGAALAVGTLPIAAVPASAASDGGGGCGAGFTESSLSALAQYAAETYGGSPSDYDFSALDKNGDSSLCWHPIGKKCPCGANAINIVDDNVATTH